jgi:hypothetical protein
VDVLEVFLQRWLDLVPVGLKHSGFGAVETVKHALVVDEFLDGDDFERGLGLELGECGFEEAEGELARFAGEGTIFDGEPVLVYVGISGAFDGVGGTTGFTGQGFGAFAFGTVNPRLFGARAPWLGLRCVIGTHNAKSLLKCERPQPGTEGAFDI